MVGMTLMERLMEYRFRIVGAASVGVALLSAVLMGPSLSAVIDFFWPLLVSTGFFLAAVALLLKISPPPETVGDRVGEELMDYVAADQQQLQEEGMTTMMSPSEEGTSEGREEEKGGDEVGADHPPAEDRSS